MRLRSEAGQAAALTAVFMTVLLGSCAAVLDVGSWFREDRDTQRIADAAALAGAQALPESPGEAQALALEYADKNGGGLNAADIEFTRTFMDNDTIRTKVERPAPGFFARLFDIDSVTVGSKAKARAGVPAAAKWVAPIVVNERHPKLVCGCFGDENPTQIDLENLHRPGSGNAAGAFALLNLNRSDSGAPGAGSLASWMQEGFPGLMDPGVYRSAPSTLFNSSEMFDALEDRTDKIVLFPVCRAQGADTCAIRRGGQNAEYTIIGWVAFHITSFDNRGSSGWIKGYFTGAVWEGALSPTSSTPDFGVRVIALID